MYICIVKKKHINVFKVLKTYQMKQILIDGRIGKNAEVLTTVTGKKYLRFPIANDTYINGENKTEWFDVTCYDPFIVEKRASFLTKGRFVIISGTLNTEVNAKNGKIYLNQYITALSIDTPSMGTKKEENTEETVSTYTGGTTPTFDTKPVEQPKQVVEVKKPEPVFSYTASSNSLNDMSDDDDLPF